MDIQLLESATPEQNLIYLRDVLGLPNHQALSLVQNHAKTPEPSPPCPTELAALRTIELIETYGEQILESYQPECSTRKVAELIGTGRFKALQVIRAMGLETESEARRCRHLFRKACYQEWRQRGKQVAWIANRYNYSQTSVSKETKEASNAA